MYPSRVYCSKIFLVVIKAFFSANHASVAKSLLTTSVVTAIKAFSVKTYKKYNREKLSTGVISKILEERDRL